MKNHLFLTILILAASLTTGYSEDNAKDGAAADARASSGGGTKVLADFNAPAPNNIDGNFGAFTPSESEQVYICKEAIDDKVRHGEKGAALRLDYNVNNGGAFNGFWMKLGPADKGNHFDASQFKKLSFWVKPDEKGGPNKFKVELKGDDGPIAKKYIGDLKAGWTKVEIPLDDFAAQGVDLTKLNEMTIVFEQRAASPKTVGALYLDDVTLEK
ncbi:MAG: hypothetical protein JO317_01490 [Verrucomicrobiae bacterium]|nr:hypothetical protein [Verrucomicrobiae bacterium]